MSVCVPLVFSNAISFSTVLAFRRQECEAEMEKVMEMVALSVQPDHNTVEESSDASSPRQEVPTGEQTTTSEFPSKICFPMTF